jgi:DNA-binding HxlR family transcriptional regulator
VSGAIAAEEEARRIMARVGAVLGRTNGEPLTAAQAELFGYLSRQVAEFDADRNCPIVSLVDHVGNYWRNWLLLILRTGTYRPSTIVRLMVAIDPGHPISHRMLTLNLRMLVRDGLVGREVVPSEINHVEYGLTPIGRELSDWILSLLEWIDRRAGEVAEARLKFDATELAR